MTKYQLTLHKPLASNVPAYPKDVLNTKQALYQIGFYQPDRKMGMHDVTDDRLFQAIYDLQKEYDLTEDGRINPDGETLDQINELLQEQSESRLVTQEELPPQQFKEPKIPGTNIPDRGLPEAYVPPETVFGKDPAAERYKMDDGIIIHSPRKPKYP